MILECGILLQWPCAGDTIFSYMTIYSQSFLDHQYNENSNTTHQKVKIILQQHLFIIHLSSEITSQLYFLALDQITSFERQVHKMIFVLVIFFFINYSLLLDHLESSWGMVCLQKYFGSIYCRKRIISCSTQNKTSVYTHVYQSNKIISIITLAKKSTNQKTWSLSFYIEMSTIVSK